LPSLRARHTGVKQVKAAYVVFRGLEIGVFLTWYVLWSRTSPPVFFCLAIHRDATAAVTSGVRFSLQQGYSIVEHAHAAFEFAHRNGWTCRSAAWAATPVSRADAPLPLPESDSDTPPSHNSVLGRRPPAGRWYVVYAGINPGVFATQCVLPPLIHVLPANSTSLNLPQC
jgi:hypothetical protein